jgi:hypothetical protein
LNKNIDYNNSEFKTSRRIISIHQPNYFPWLGYFYKIYQSDIFVFLDDVQFSNEGMHNYCYIKTPQGPFRLRIPVQQSLGNKINEVRARYELKWCEKHLKTIESNYRRANYFYEVFNDISELIGKEYVSIASMNNSIIKFIAEKLRIETQYIISSELDIDGEKEEKILNICNKLGGKIYYSGTGAKAYQNEGNFKSRGIELRYSVFTPFSYPQLWNGFQSNVTIIDYLMNCGYDWDRVLNSQKKE